MARVDIAQGAATGGTSGAVRFQSGMGHISTGAERKLPVTTTAYVTGGLWRFFERIDTLLLDSRHQTYQPGESYERTINVGVFGPGIGPGQGLYRTSGDTLMANLGLHTDGAGNIGAQESWVSGSTTLYRDGEELASVPEPLAYWTRFALPEEPGTYRLSTTGAYDGPLSSEISASFTFASSPVTGEEPTRLPASVVRFTPRLDLDSTAPSGARTTVPLALSGSAGWEDLASLTVEVSYDRGGSWQQVPVEDHAVMVTNPAAGGSVSFRAELADRDGNTTSQTILDAYRTR
jgi:hypothetical protein